VKTLDNNEIIIYNIDINKNRGKEMKEVVDPELKKIKEILERLEEKENEKTILKQKIEKAVRLWFLIMIPVVIVATIYVGGLRKERIERYQASERAGEDRKREREKYREIKTGI